MEFIASPILAAFEQQRQNNEEENAHESASEANEENEEQEVNITKQSTKRHAQQVSTLSVRLRVVKWMIQFAAANGNLKLISQTVDHFSDVFRSSRNANLQKCARWWKNRESICAKDKKNNPKTVNHLMWNGRKKINRKSSPGRGRKRSEWVIWLYEELLDEFHRLRKAGLKFDPALLRVLARDIIGKNAHDVFNAFYKDPKDGKLIGEKITCKWIQNFMEANNVVMRTQTGKLSVSPEKQEFIDKTIAYHLGDLKRKFEKNELDEDMIYNMDETHFVVNMDNKKQLCVRGEEEVKYADVVSGGEAMTMVVLISGGRKAKIEIPLLIFTNKNRSYLIMNLPDNQPGVAYRSGPKGWMDGKVFPEWLSEKRSEN